MSRLASNHARRTCEKSETGATRQDESSYPSRANNEICFENEAGRVFQRPLLGDDAGAGGLHLEDLNGVVHTFGGVVEDKTGIGNVGIEQLVLSTAKIDVAIIDSAILVDVVVERQL